MRKLIMVLVLALSITSCKQNVPPTQEELSFFNVDRYVDYGSGVTTYLTKEKLQGKSNTSISKLLGGTIKESYLLNIEIYTETPPAEKSIVLALENGQSITKSCIVSGKKYVKEKLSKREISVGLNKEDIEVLSNTSIVGYKLGKYSFPEKQGFTIQTQTKFLQRIKK